MSPRATGAARALRTTGATAGALLAAGTLLAGCAAGEEVTIAGDEYAGRAQTHEAAAPARTPSRAPEAPAAPTGGPYADGEYTSTQTYGVLDDLLEQDSIDVTVTLADGVVTEVEVVGHPFAERSKDYMQDFVNEVAGEVVGRSVEQAHVTALAGASKTSDAFNEAIDAIAAQAAGAAAQQ
ncbi:MULTISPECIES: FMN-binding protein [unclassified Actinomyces]|uniref:FMN-binding protein n=3 Tax=Actinomyces TaxID=1654 RepID=UPI0020174722|nr:MULTISPECIES: FMN-binding protein [unclassified Actinomyces]MCL3776693.1 FMN-binding protein [Actinomyces sp. AC-20-1]MCL3790616.1 FMN-binding protein [Actinomyces sp. 187325]MCL3792943.1 FMN-binding protein [Actinomyces sp. 186855]MCL3795356.1 FMN-binding protein [Actinomyces sp. 217892]